MASITQTSQCLFCICASVLMIVDLAYGYCFTSVPVGAAYLMLFLLQAYLARMAWPGMGSKGERRPKVRVALFGLCLTFWTGRAADMDKAPAWCPENDHWRWLVCLSFFVLLFNAVTWVLWIPVRILGPRSPPKPAPARGKKKD
eukprot:CAMPEP_0179333360 /NCGR_PEP_ID=MMETSP0797-20121207/65261_1 /TAXON_ID=47934 /ORGANISM="Dinophysis acuminata, Strain DAEP01" /LENGTH=143 /DNA_ID=CAMNT_0021046361 /DNA_START=44 /DNA_END=475 /DNA_ORIENTATION=+